MKRFCQIIEEFDERFMLNLMRKAFDAKSGSPEQKKLLNQLNAYRVKYGMDPVPMGEAVSPAQQAAIAIAKKKSGKYDKDGNRKEEFEVHYMYKDGKKKKVEKPEEHERLSKLGWVHKEETKYDYGTDASVKHMKKVTPGQQEAVNMVKLVKDLWGKSVHRDDYKRALEVLKGLVQRKEKESKGSLRHSITYYAQEIGKQFKGVDARQLAKMYNREVRESVMSELEEGLSVAARRRRGLLMKRLSKRIALKKKIKMRKFADTSQLKRRAQKAARRLLRKRLLGKKASAGAWAKLSPQQKIAIDKIVDKKKAVLPKIAARLLPKIKRAERERLKRLKLKGKGLGGAINKVIQK